MAIGWELAEWGRDFACPVAIANRGDDLNPHFLWYFLCALVGAGIAAYGGHYWGRRPTSSWRTDGSQEGAA